MSGIFEKKPTKELKSVKGTYIVRSTVECSLLCLSELETCSSYSYQHLTQKCDISDEETIDSVDVSQSAQVYEGKTSHT